MSRSTLSPGRPSAAIVKLREAAMREMSTPFVGVQETKARDFDVNHAVGNDDYMQQFPVFPGYYNPHVGNGRGPVG